MLKPHLISQALTIQQVTGCSSADAMFAILSLDRDGYLSKTRNIPTTFLKEPGLESDKSINLWKMTYPEYSTVVDSLKCSDQTAIRVCYKLHTSGFFVKSDRVLGVRVCSTCGKPGCAPMNHAGWHPDDG